MISTLNDRIYVPRPSRSYELFLKPSLGRIFRPILNALASLWILDIHGRIFSLVGHNPQTAYFIISMNHNTSGYS